MHGCPCVSTIYQPSGKAMPSRARSNHSQAGRGQSQQRTGYLIFSPTYRATFVLWDQDCRGRTSGGTEVSESRDAHQHNFEVTWTQTPSSKATKPPAPLDMPKLLIRRVEKSQGKERHLHQHLVFELSNVEHTTVCSSVNWRWISFSPWVCST